MKVFTYLTNWEGHSAHIVDYLGFVLEIERDSF